MATTNTHRLTLRQWLADNGYESIDTLIEGEMDMLMDSVQPALCTDGCEVEPDGHCPHGCPSISLALGVI